MNDITIKQLHNLKGIKPTASFRKQMEGLVYPPRIRERARYFSVGTTLLILLLLTNFTAGVAASQPHHFVYPVKQVVQSLLVKDLSVKKDDQTLEQPSPTVVPQATPPVTQTPLTSTPIQKTTPAPSTSISVLATPTFVPTATPAPVLGVTTATDSVSISTPVVDVQVGVNAGPSPTQSESSKDSTSNGAGTSLLPDLNLELKLPKLGL